MNQSRTYAASLLERPGTSLAAKKTAKAGAGRHVEHGVGVVKTEHHVVIGNDLLARRFTIRDGCVRTREITNFRTQEAQALQPGAGSEEFTIHTVDAEGKRGVIDASSFSLRDILVSDLPEGDGKLLVFDFAPLEALGVHWGVRLAYAMKSGASYMRKFLSLHVPEGERDAMKIDQINLEYLAVGRGVTHTWSRPEMAPASISGYQMGLGQPVYLDALYLGCEFPAAENRIVDGVAQMKYFSGKTFAQLDRMKDGGYVTWQAVLGAARSAEQEVLRADFLAYIESIAAPLSFRKQYNSWMDHMLDISEENIEGSFYQIEKGLTQHGVEPLDGYVVDDGWNDYDADFWSFDRKFPNGMTDAAALAGKFGSRAGLWLGPRGGFVHPDRFARQLEKAGAGGYNAASHDVCVAHPAYCKRLEAWMLEQMARHGIGYWKLDGFALEPCGDPGHGHIVGGENGMYYFTELWERWIELFESLRRTDPSVWLNLTCYVNPSPWLLQWVQTVWLQNSEDLGFLQPVGGRGLLPASDEDRMVSYRDDRYFDFLQERQLQFPLAHLYNHDPIYGNHADIAMSTEEFREYLYMNATRGSAFWELYYSYNLMDEEKWLVNAEVLRWAQENFHILRNAKLFGESPAKGGVYGYASWDEGEGILSLRNPSAHKQTVTVTLDRLIGVPDGTRGLCRFNILPYVAGMDVKRYAYGDTITAEIPGHATFVWRFGPEDVTRPEIVTSRAISNKTIEITFSEYVAAGKKNFQVEGNTLESAVLEADYKTVLLTFTDEFLPGSRIEVDIVSLTDMAANEMDAAIIVPYYENDVVARVTTSADLESSLCAQDSRNEQYGVEAIRLTKRAYALKASASIAGTGGFTVAISLKTVAKAAAVLEQPGAWSLRLDEKGRAVFTVDGLSVATTIAVNTGIWRYLCAVREKNGMLKLYLDGVLDASAYDASRCADLTPASLTLGGETYEGEIGRLTLYNRALGFDEIARRAREYGLYIKKYYEYHPKKKDRRIFWYAAAAGAAVSSAILVWLRRKKRR